MLRASWLSQRRSSPLTLTLVLLAASLLSCAKSKTTGCGFGLICPEGTVCSSDGASCIAPSSQCGDGIVQAEAGEQCDDGNSVGGDGCSADCKSTEICGNGRLDLSQGEVCDDGNTVDGDGCSADCRSRSVCGDGRVDPGEECDDGNDSNDDDCLRIGTRCVLARCNDGYVDSQGRNKELCDPRVDPASCDLDCTPRECGDRIVNGAGGEQCDPPGPFDGFFCTTACTVARCGDHILTPETGEECDDGNASDNDDCLSTCRRSRCGDGLVDQTAPGIESCDDGNTTTEAECPYGTRACTACDSTCSSVVALAGRYCGDGVINDPSEACDDGNTTTETACPYGVATCTGCSADCSQVLNLQGSFCGDGVASATEACDDGNTEACGTCNATCTAFQLANATGFIEVVTGSQLFDAETFSISDGTNLPVIFEFDTNGSTQTGHIAVAITSAMTATQVASTIEQVINAQPFSVTATATGSRVDLTNDNFGAFGNQAMTEQVRNTSFKISGMSGGTSSDCPAGTGCTFDEDCAPGLTCSASKKCQ